jgi:branched-chain amino acid transport system ATP-binding protein
MPDKMPSMQTNAPNEPHLLEVEDLQVAYGDLQVLWGVSLTVAVGEIATLIGSNGAGKTTLLRALSGIVRKLSGTVRFAGQLINELPPHRIASLGIAHVPEGRGIFPNMTVAENLSLGAYNPAVRAQQKRNFEWVVSLFPLLRQRLKQDAGTMSGGEQQMLAVGRALMAEPQLILLDEPSQGLQPNLVDQLFETIAKVARQGVAVLLVEQNVAETLELADRFYVLETGRIVHRGKGGDALSDANLRAAYLGL